MPDDGITILKQAIGRGGEDRLRAFAFIEKQFGEEFKRGGERAFQAYKDMYELALTAGGDKAGKEFTACFLPMLPKLDQDQLPARLFLEGIVGLADEIEARNKRRGFFSRLFSR
jgi:hypothetical protein